ncbi:MAG TPA: electron transport complex subunit RsxC, partial [Spirochaetia bacterium]|nr:electron transport complex subunit RsxC [Spirochaetia bacterium]
MRTVTFRKGVHPRYHKSNTSGKPIENVPTPDFIVLPLLQHLGAPAKPIKNKGDAVSVGEAVCDLGGRISAKIHSPV